MAAKQYFSKDFPAFFEELEKNNHKDWFDENRKRYESEIREPFKTFVAEAYKELSPLDDMLVSANPKKSVFRINRDIRFSKDKTPYKTHYAAIVGPHGTRAKDEPGMYLEFSHRDFRIYGGFYSGSSQQIADIRYFIAQHMDNFQSLYNDKDFKKAFVSIHGEKSKRIPKDLRGIAEKEPLLWNKQFYFYRKFDPRIISSENLLPTIVEHYKTMMPLTRFIRAALGLQPMK